MLLAALWAMSSVGADTPPAADPKPQLSQARQSLEQIDAYLQSLYSQIDAMTVRAEEYLDMADAETDPVRRAKFEQLHGDLSARLDELMTQRERTEALRDQSLRLLEQLEHER